MPGLPQAASEASEAICELGGGEGRGGELRPYSALIWAPSPIFTTGGEATVLTCAEWSLLLSDLNV